MKNLFYTTAFALSTLALTTACYQEECVEAVEPQEETLYDFTLKATMPEADTRTWVEGTTVKWNEDDAIKVFWMDDEYKYHEAGTLTLSSCETSGTTAWFSGKISCERSKLHIAAYPASRVDLYDGVLNFEYRHRYTYNYSSSDPYMRTDTNMEGTIPQDMEVVNFKQIFSIIRINLTNVPAGISGNLYLKCYHKLISQDATMATVTFSNTASSEATLTFDIPISPGNDITDEYTASILFNGDTEEKQLGSVTVTSSYPTRGQIIVMTPSTDYIDLVSTAFGLEGNTGSFTQSEAS